MKNFFLLGVFLFSSVAFSREFYKAKVKVKMTYSRAGSKTITIAKMKANLLVSDDNSYCQIETKKSRFECGARFGSARSYSVTLNKEESLRFLKEEMGISDAVADSLKDNRGLTYSRSYSSYSGTSRKSSVQLHTSNVAESYHVHFKAYKARFQ